MKLLVSTRPEREGGTEGGCRLLWLALFLSARASLYIIYRRVREGLTAHVRRNCFYSAGWTFCAFHFFTLLACFWSPSDCKKIPDISLRSIQLTNNFRFARYRSIFFGNHCSSIARQEKITFRLGSPDQNKQT